MSRIAWDLLQAQHARRNSRTANSLISTRGAKYSRVTYESPLELRGRVHVIGALFEHCESCVECGLVVAGLVEGVAVELDLYGGG